MTELTDTLKTVKKALKPQAALPKYTPKQFKQQAKVLKTLIKVLGGVDSFNSLQQESKKMVSKLEDTFVHQASEKANLALSSLVKSETHGAESAQSTGRAE